MIHTKEPVDVVNEKLLIECPFGQIEYTEEDVLSFPDGLYGYDQHREFLVWNEKKFIPFQWLISLENPELMFPVVDPKLICPDYDPNHRHTFEWDTMLVVVTMGDSVESVTANLRAPILLSTGKNVAKQVILTDTNYPLQYRVMKSE